MTNLSSNQQNHSLTSRTRQFYYKVYLENGQTRCCGSEKDLDIVLSIFPGSEVQKVFLPETPSTIDVPHVRIGEEYSLPMQQILPESQSLPLDL